LPETLNASKYSIISGSVIEKSIESSSKSSAYLPKISNISEVGKAVYSQMKVANSSILIYSIPYLWPLESSSINAALWSLSEVLKVAPSSKMSILKIVVSILFAGILMLLFCCGLVSNEMFYRIGMLQM